MFRILEEGDDAVQAGAQIKTSECVSARKPHGLARYQDEIGHTKEIKATGYEVKINTEDPCRKFLMVKKKES